MTFYLNFLSTGIFTIIVLLVTTIKFTLHKYHKMKKSYTDLDYSLLDVSEEIVSVINSINSFASLHDIKIKYLSTLEDHLFVKGNRTQFRQAILNLMNNGIVVCQNGVIEIAVHEMMSCILIVIEDNGIGMTQEQLGSLGSSLRSNQKRGTPPEVVVSYNIIHSMSGKVKVESEQGKGTIFSIMIPKAS